MVTLLKVCQCSWRALSDSLCMCECCIMYTGYNKGTMWYPCTTVSPPGSNTHAWCITAVSLALYVVGLTHWDQKGAPSCMTFFITNNALTHRLSSLSRIGTMVLSKVIACSGTFSPTSFSASHFPRCSRVNVTHKKRGRFDGEIKQKEGQCDKNWDGGGGERNDTLLPHLTPTSSEGNSSKRGLCFQTQIQQNTGCCHETSKWAILTSEGLQMLEELSVSGQGDWTERTEGTCRLLTTSMGTTPESASPPKMPIGTRSVKASTVL